MSYFVFFDDGYCDNGDVGLKEFSGLDDATNFISDRLRQMPGRSVDSYALIEGRKVALKAVEVITKVVAERG